MEGCRVHIMVSTLFFSSLAQRPLDPHSPTIRDPRNKGSLTCLTRSCLSSPGVFFLDPLTEHRVRVDSVVIGGCTLSFFFLHLIFHSFPSTSLLRHWYSLLGSYPYKNEWAISSPCLYEHRQTNLFKLFLLSTIFQETSCTESLILFPSDPVLSLSLS